MLVQYGFRLPSAYDNRPLTFDEFTAQQEQAVYVSATPAAYERGLAGSVVEQIVRPTGLVDPGITVMPAKERVEHLLGEIRAVAKMGFRTLVTTLARDVWHLRIIIKSLGCASNTCTRISIRSNAWRSSARLTLGEFSVLVGINLLREGLVCPKSRWSPYSMPTKIYATRPL